jgi:hypothetical protein
MTQAGKRSVGMRALVVDGGLTGHTAISHAVRASVEDLRGRDVLVVESTSLDDGAITAS